MPRYLLTHSLLSSWLYAMKSNPYEDATTSDDPLEEFLRVLRREPTETTEAMQNGLLFESMVDAVSFGEVFDTEHPWADAVRKTAEMVSGSISQYKAKTEIVVSGMTVLLYGRIDFLKAGKVIDTKFSKSYERGKYYDSTQHPVYLRLIPEADEFIYLISNGTEVWTERYLREETSDIETIIAEFFEFLKCNGLMDVYKQFWIAK